MTHGNNERFYKVLFLVFLFAPGTIFSIGKDTISFTITRKPHALTSNFYHPYAVWWVEDENQNLIKILHVTFYQDGNPGNQERCGKSGFLFTLTYFRNKFGDLGCPTLPGEQCKTCPSCPSEKSSPLVDGITGCSEASGDQGGKDVTVSHFWDLTNRKGKRVPAGIYSLYYNAVFADEDAKELDKTFRVKINISHEGFDTTVINPLEISGNQVNSQTNDKDFIVTQMRIEFGGNAGGSNTGSQANNLPFHNIEPDPPTEKVEGPSNTCGSGGSGDSGGSGILMSLPVLIGLSLSRKRKKRSQRIDA